MYEQYRGLIFDMDGTLVDSGQLHEQAWLATLNEFSIRVNRPLMRSLCGVPTRATLALLIEKFGCDHPASLDDMNHFKEQFVHREMHRFVKPTALIDVVTTYYGKKPIAVGTGAVTQEAQTILRLCDLEKYVDVVVGADQVANPKPAPDTFLCCAELLKLSPHECVVFEDAPLGLQAAQSAGMQAIDVLEIHGVVNNYFL